MFAEVKHNEERAAEIEVPVFVLEQKVEKLEQLFDSWNLNMTEKLTGAVCSKIDRNPSLFLPEFCRSIESLKRFQNEYETKLSLGIIGQGGGGGGPTLGLDAEGLKDLKFMLNNSKRETETIKKLFTP